MKSCKKCLLLEAGESVTYKEITDYINSLDKSERADGASVEKRLVFCKSCSSLISGMCLKCGCYVEVRASLKDGSCPDEIW